MKSARKWLWALCLLPLTQQVFAQTNPVNAPMVVLPPTPLPDSPLVIGADTCLPDAPCRPWVPVMMSSSLPDPILVSRTTSTTRTVPVTTTVDIPVQSTQVSTQRITRTIGTGTPGTVVSIRPAQVVVSFRTVVTPTTTIVPVTTTTFQTKTTQQTQEYRIPASGSSWRISDNESAAPQTRVFYFFDDWYNAYNNTNARLGGNASIPSAYRNTLGFEQAFLDGNASVTVRLPINTLEVNSSLPGAGGDDTSIGDLFLASKFVLWGNTQTGSLVSAGLAMTVPTGTHAYGGADTGDFTPNHHVNLQPYIGYIWRPTARFYVQGFSSVDVPMATSDVTLMYNDVGVGYFLYTAPQGLITAVIPTFEVRDTEPMNHFGLTTGQVIGETPIVELLAGVTVEISRAVTITVGGGLPVTGLKPYDWEFLAQLNYRF